jgi:hypothetical protein
MCRLSFPQLAEARTYLLGIKETTGVPDAREFSADSLDWCELEREFAAEVEDSILPLVKNHRADFRVLSVGEGFPHRQYASADPRPRFEDCNLVTRGLESVCGYKT